MNAGGDEWNRRNAEEIDHDKTDLLRIGTTRRELNERYLVDVPRDARVLEVGSGYGRGLKALREVGFWRLLGLDINMAGLNRSSFAGVQAEWTRLPFEDESFDMVCTNGTLMHVHPSEMRRVVDEIMRVARRWFWCFEQVTARQRTVTFAPDLQIPPAYLWDLPAVLGMLRPELRMARGHVWEGPKGQYVMLLYEKT